MLKTVITKTVTPTTIDIKHITRKFFFVCLLHALGLYAYSQCAMKNDGFQSGERVTYDLSFNWKFVWTKAGHATLSFDKIDHESKPAYRIDLIAVGNKRADFFFKLRDTLTSVISERLEPIYFRKGAVEGKRYWVDEAFFTYNDGVSYVKQKRTRDGQVKEYEGNDSRCIYDLLSVLAWARSLNMEGYEAGDRIHIPVATGKRVEEQTLIFRGRETYKAENEITYNCLVFSLVETKKGKEQEVITFNVTDDLNRLPVRIDLSLSFGSAKASMNEAVGSKYPFTSIVTE